MLPSELMNTTEQFMVHCMFIGMKHISPTFIIPIYLRLTTFQKPSPKCHFTYIFLLFLFRSGAPPVTLLNAGALTAARDSFKRVHDLCKAGWRRPGGPPTKILATPVYIIVI